MGDLSEHFDRREFRCKCYQCDYDDPQPELVNLLEAIRAECGGHPMLLNSASRCPTHNRNVGGASNSRHVSQDAADIVVDGVPVSEVYQVAERLLAGRGGLGKYKTFTHVDTRPNGPARWSG